MQTTTTLQELLAYARRTHPLNNVVLAPETLEALVLEVLEQTVWYPIETAPKDADLLLTDGTSIFSGIWDSVDYDEFRGEHVMGWVYGPADIDPTNFWPTHWRPYPKEMNLHVNATID